MLRVAICVAALWFVLRGVSLDDHLVVREDGTRVAGLIFDRGDHVDIVLSDGRTSRVSISDVAVDADGRPQLFYGLRSAWRQSVKSLLLLALLIHLPVGVFQAIRLKWLLRAQWIALGLWPCIKLSFAGNFLNFATPLGSNAGDVFKAYFITTHTQRKTEAATTIVLDRVIGLVTLLICVATILVVAGAESRLGPFRNYVLGAVGFGVVAAAFYFSSFVRRHLVPRSWLTRLPMFEQLQRIDRTAKTLVQARWTLLGAAVVTIVLQVTALGAYFTVAVAMNLEAHAGNVLEYFACFYTGALIQALPGPPQGLGTVELAYSYFFAPYGGASQILGMAFLTRCVVLACALPGLLVTLTGSYRPTAPRTTQLESGADGEPSSDAARKFDNS